jgi:hypothetical protein
MSGNIFVAEKTEITSLECIHRFLPVFEDTGLTGPISSIFVNFYKNMVLSRSLLHRITVNLYKLFDAYLSGLTAMIAG